MPDGKTHAIATSLAAGMIAPGLHHFAGTSIPSVIALSLGTLTGLLVNPDLDVHTGSRSFSLVASNLPPGWPDLAQENRFSITQSAIHPSLVVQ